MDLKGKLLEVELKNQTTRLAKLQAINAPEIMLNQTQGFIDGISKGEFEVTDKENLLGLEYLSHEVKTGNGGKPYVQFTTACGKLVNYFPNGRYGRFISINK